MRGGAGAGGGGQGYTGVDGTKEAGTPDTTQLDLPLDSLPSFLRSSAYSSLLESGPDGRNRAVRSVFATQFSCLWPGQIWSVFESRHVAFIITSISLHRVTQRQS